MVLKSYIAIARQYHVAQETLGDDDRNPGTADQPFNTINAAVVGARLKPGGLSHAVRWCKMETLKFMNRQR